MATGINWCGETWNPTRGCTRVSEGCRHCYAEQQAGRIVRMAKGKPSPYDGLVALVGGEWRWTGRVDLDRKKLAEPLYRRKPTVYFVDSMSDLFHGVISNAQIAAIFGVMAACPQHTFIALTKRSGRMRAWFEWLRERASDRASFDGDPIQWCHGQFVRSSAIREGVVEELGPATDRWPLPNVWLGVSVEDQESADKRLPDLVATPAAIRLISAEPLLGSVDLRRWLADLQWVIAGCESGPAARPCEVGWLRDLRDQCVESETAFWLKQARSCGILHSAHSVEELIRGLNGSPEDSSRLYTIAVGPGSRRHKGLIDLPYLDGVQWSQRPSGDQ